MGDSYYSQLDVMLVWLDVMPCRIVRFVVGGSQARLHLEQYLLQVSATELGSAQASSTCTRKITSGVAISISPNPHTYHENEKQN